jgi:two-component system LytT family response regulator
MIRTLIVDDEEPARERLRELLAAVPDVEVVAEAGNGEEAIRKTVELRPDLLLLDIQMPGSTGLEIAACLPGPRPKIIFCTAFDQYAVDAFELHAVDYLLKPVNRIRLAHAIERARDRAPAASEAEIDRLTQAVAGRAVRLLARSGDRYRVIPQRDVVYFSCEDKLTRLHTRDKQYLLDPTLNELEARLDPALFYRISRSVLVNLDCVREVRPLAGGIADLTLSTGELLEVSRRRLRELLDRLAGVSGAGPRGCV